MNLLLVSSTKLEILPLLGKLSFSEVNKNTPFSLEYKKNQIDIIISGIGAMHMGYSLGKYYQNKSCDLAINIGIAGSFIHSVMIGEVVNVTEDVIGDLGVDEGEIFLDIFDLGLENKNHFPYKNGKLINKKAFQNNTIEQLTKVSGVTVNKILHKENHIELLRQKYNPHIETMEGAAFFYASKMVNVPCYQIRSISNYVGERDKSKWDISLAVENLNNTVYSLLNNI